MKKIILVVVALFASISSFGQESKESKKGNIQFSVYGGKPVGYLNGDSDFNGGVSIGYLGNINKIVRVGGSLGYDHSHVKMDSKLKDRVSFEYLMIGGTAEVDVYQNFYVGADLGLAFKMDTKSNQTHYFTPKVGYRFTDMINFYAHYKGVRFSGYQVSSVGLGVSLDF